eukprot:TRINITY_DN19507_c0_g1_i1.p2 TRINITY_DN19507_c0_g1~~TRINITY_DN19507_c0_g1_i1.p2  ORF type:complete len:129 (+),score=57.45 TRINITY_DN19507_c0_g1_i1:24-410(+)
MMNRGMRGSGTGLTGSAFPGRQGKGQPGASQVEAEQFMEQQNDEGLQRLAGLVGSLKETVIDIGTTTQQQNTFLDNLMQGMGGANNAVKGTISRLDEVMKKGGSGHICALGAFVVFVLIGLYYLIKFR